MLDNLLDKNYYIVAILGILCLNSQLAWAHSVEPSTQLLAIRNETFSDQTLKTGDDQIIKGEIHNLSSEPIKVSLSLSAETSPLNTGARWTIIQQEPAGEEIAIPPSETVEYSLTAKWLKRGTYHVHTALEFGNFLSAGSMFGQGATTVVSGDPISHSSDMELPALLLLVAAGVIVAVVVVKRRKRYGER